MIQKADVAGQEARPVELLHAAPGVGAVKIHGEGQTSIEARVQVDFDPAVTNPILMHDALARRGFTVLSADEEPPTPQSATPGGAWGGLRFGAGRGSAHMFLAS